MIFRVIVVYPDPNGAATLVRISTPDGVTRYQAEKAIQAAWDEFQAGEPDCDGDFGDFLCRAAPTFRRMPDDDVDVLVMGR